MYRYTLTSLLCLAAIGSALRGGENLARNAGFETDAGGDGIPDQWRVSGAGSYVTQELALDNGREGGRCARLSCTRFRSGSPAAHAMVCQMGVPVRRGTVYRVSLWARAEKIRADIVSVALSDTSVWASCGLSGSFAPGPVWQRFEFYFRAQRTCSTASRVTGTALRVLDIMGRPSSENGFVPDGTPVYVVGSNVTPEEFETAVRSR